MNVLVAFVLWFIATAAAAALVLLRIYGHEPCSAQPEKFSKRARQRTEKPLAPYRCAHCGFWHVGQNTGLKQPVKTIRNNHQLRFL